MIRLLVPFLGVCVMAVGCGPPTTAFGFHPRVVELEELEVISPSVRFAGVREIVLQGDAVWVLDSRPPFVTRVSAGSSVSIDAPLQFGEAGEGPGELIDPRGLILTEDGIDVWDFSANKRVSFTQSGAFRSVHTLAAERSGWIRPDMAEVSHLDPWRVRWLGDRVAFTSIQGMATSPEDFARASVALGSRDLETAGRVFRFADAMPRDARASGQFPWMPVWDACGQTIVSWDPRMGRVEWRNLNGTVRQSVDLPMAGQPITLAGVEGFLAQMVRHEVGPSHRLSREALTKRAKEVRPLFVGEAPPFGDIACGSDRSAWLNVFDLTEGPLGRSAIWLHVRPGSDVKAVEFPGSFAPAVFDASAVFGVLSEVDGDRLAVWRRSRS